MNYKFTLRVCAIRLSLSCFLAFVALSAVWGQGSKSREQLEQEKRDNLEKIKEAQQVLKKTRSQKMTSLAQVRALSEQIDSQEEQLNLMSQDLTLIETEMLDLQSSIAMLETKLVKLRKEYAEILYRTSKSSGRLNQLSFILSSTSFADLFLRYKYIKQYADNRVQHLKQINRVKQSLAQRQAKLGSKKTEKVAIRQRKVAETQQLESLKTQKAATVADLSKREAELRADIATSQKAIRKLDNLISSIVSREIARQTRAAEARREVAAAKARAEAAVPPPTSPAATESKPTAVAKTRPPAPPPAEPAEIKMRGTKFGDNQRRLPWPMQGIISDRFGVKNHPVLANVKVDNNGVDIQSGGNSSVRTVYEGIVMDISEIPGMGQVVTVQHGDYYTVYANLQEVFVSPDQSVGAREAIGNAAMREGVYQINFQVWHKFQRLNPESWLARR